MIVISFWKHSHRDLKKSRSRRHDSGPNPAVRTLIRVVFLWTIGALLFVFHGISFHTTPWSQKIINGIVKYVYPPTFQEDTTVVLFREENLRDPEESYPVSYKRHAEVLDALSAYKPRAVFVDFAFIDKRSREDVKRLCEAIHDLGRPSSDGHRTSVYLAVPTAPPKAVGQKGAREPQLSAVPPKAVGQKETTREPPEPPLKELLKCGAIPVSAGMGPDNGVSGVLEYSHVGDTILGPQPAPAFEMLPDDLKLIPREPMEIIWGNRVPPLNKKWMDCESEDWPSQLIHMLKHDPMSVKLECPYTQTISVRHLLASVSDPDVEKALEHRTVFYGGGFHMTGDRVVSPVYDELPAVYLHAMAYDNLRTFGANYKRRDAVIFDGVLLLAVIAILLCEEYLHDQRLARVKPLFKWLALGGAALFSIAFAVTSLLPVTRSVVLWTAALGGPLLLGVFAVLHLADTRHLRTTREFVARLRLAVGIVGLAVLGFLLVVSSYGIEAALLVVLPFYFFYKLLVSRDMLFVATFILLVVASVLSFWPMNRGPRNIIAYLLFFEVMRHLIKHLGEVAAEYFRLRKHDRENEERNRSGRWLHVLDWFFTLCLRDEDKETTNANRTSHAA